MKGSGDVFWTVASFTNKSNFMSPVEDVERQYKYMQNVIRVLHQNAN